MCREKLKEKLLVPERENQGKPVPFPDHLTGPSCGLLRGSLGFSALG